MFLSLRDAPEVLHLGKVNTKSCRARLAKITEVSTKHLRMRTICGQMSQFHHVQAATASYACTDHRRRATKHSEKQEITNRGKPSLLRSLTEGLFKDICHY